jgi:selenocysteine-specific elongation factor
LIVGTAGHVDHGKSTLVEALTGHAVDRLAEERRRGLTIELNFARLELGGAGLAGVVDVPGHEDLVRTMAAGASGMDVVLLVVAADEGIRPQTREHRAVLEALRVPRGIPVITRADMVTVAAAASIAAEVAGWLADSAVAFEAPVVVSARTGQGVAELRAAIAGLAPPPPQRDGGRVDLFRLNVDRCFSVPGAGTVVTGSVVSGEVRAGDTVALRPGPASARVRSVQSFGRRVAVAGRGERVGLALALDAGQAARGLAMVAPGEAWRETLALDVALEPAPGAEPPGHGARVRVLVGTAEWLARVRRRVGRPGLVRLALEAPMIARGGGRFVLRSFSPVATLGGGEVLDPSPPPRAPWPNGLESADPGTRLRALVARRPEAVRMAEVPVLLGVPPDGVGNAVRAAGLVVHSGFLLDPEPVARARAAVEESLRRAGEGGVSLAQLRTLPRHSPVALAAALAALELEGALPVRDGLARAGMWPVESPPEVAALGSRVEAQGLAGASTADLGGRAISARLRAAERDGLIVQLGTDRWLGSAAARQLHSVLRELAETGEITPGRLRERTGLSRKYLIPLLEWADRQGWTLRQGPGRVAGPRIA